MEPCTRPQKFKIKWNTREQGHVTISELVKKLAVPPEKRTDCDCKLIADALHVFISSIAPFKEEFKRSDALAVAKRAELQTVDARQTVFRQGEVGSEFFFVLQGSVAVQVGTKIVKILGDKTAFGELALQYNCKRSASVLGAEDATHLLVVSKKLYHRHFAETHRKDMASKMEFIEKLNAGHLTPDEIAILCTHIKMHKVAKNQKICSATGPAQNLYYLIEGRAQEHGCNNANILRKLLRDPPKEQSENAILEVCKSLHVPKGKTKEIMEMLKKTIYDNVSLSTNEPTNCLRDIYLRDIYRLAPLMAGQVFGESSWVYGSQAMTTVVARSDCKLWVLPFTCVNKLVEEHDPVRHHLHKMARQKLQFRLARFDTLNCAKKVTTARMSRSKELRRSPSVRSSTSFDGNSTCYREGESKGTTPRASRAQLRLRENKKFFSRSPSSFATPNHTRHLSPLAVRDNNKTTETAKMRRRRKIRCMPPVHKPVLHGFIPPVSRSTSTRDLSSRNLFGAGTTPRMS